MSEKQLKSRHGTRYSFSVVLTTFFLSLSGTFQLGFQDIFYEHYNKAFNPEINEEMYYFPTEEKMVHDTNATRGFNTTTIKPKNFENFSPRVSHTLLYFHLGAAIGSLLFGSIFLKLGAKWSFLLFSGLGILTSPLIALGEIIQDHFLLLLIIRSFYGICIGFLTCLQIFVLNDIAFDEDRNVFNFFIILGLPLGAFAGLFAGYEPFTDAEIWYGGHLFSIFPLLISFIFGLLFFRDSLSTLILKGNDEKAIKSAKHYYGDFRAGFALAETYDRIKIRPSVPTAITIWSDKIALKALFLSVLVNFVAGFSGDRFSWIFLYRYLTATNEKVGLVKL
uniref:Major facilitator superfamily (MFS) profile domain-containing protein n=1 Tax=Panagrolaimus davidi TaxID=227884 RepID=A0A914P8C7_9BILA